MRRRSLGWPISLAIVMIVSLVALTVGWILLSAQANYWLALSVGAALFVLILVGVVLYLILTIKEINLNQRQSNFFDSITHELKSPIASLKLYLQTLRRHPMDPQEQSKFYDDMLDDVERLDGLINHMLAAARIERPADDEPRAVLLPDLIRQCVESVCNQHRVDCEVVALRLEPVSVLARTVDLELVFRNLIDNALKYAGDPPEVSVSCCAEDDTTAIVRVIDNGRGIPRHQREKAFSRFVRLVPELERDKPGTGLGLYIVRTIVGRLRGRVRITSRPADQGTELQVRLPRYHPGPEPHSHVVVGGEA